MSENSHQHVRVDVIPTLRYRDAPAAITWLCRAFGFEQRMVVRGDDDTIIHAQLVFGRGMIMLASARNTKFDTLQKPPRDVGGVGTQSAYVIVEDVDRHYERAVAAGAEIVVEPTTEDHGRGYSCRDPEGHLWNFGNYSPWITA